MFTLIAQHPRSLPVLSCLVRRAVGLVVFLLWALASQSAMAIDANHPCSSEGDPWNTWTTTLPRTGSFNIVDTYTLVLVTCDPSAASVGTTVRVGVFGNIGGIWGIDRNQITVTPCTLINSVPQAAAQLQALRPAIPAADVNRIANYYSYLTNHAVSYCFAMAHAIADQNAQLHWSSYYSGVSDGGQVWGDGNSAILFGDPSNPSTQFTLTKTAVPPVLKVGASGQSYQIAISVVSGPTSAPIALTDNLPLGVAIAGRISATGGTLSGCPSSGNNLTGCTIAPSTNGPVVITVPVSVSSAAAVSTTNAAIITGGGLASYYCPGCYGSTTNGVLDAVDDVATKPAGTASTSDVSVNDKVPSGSTFTVTGGTCASMAPASPASNTTGILGYTLPLGTASCTVVYQLCAAAPNAGICDTATLTVSGDGSSGTALSVRKAMGNNRASNNDQFTLQITSNGNTLASATTQGSGNSVTPGTGSINGLVATAGSSYTIGETMAAGSDSPLSYYTAALGCTNLAGASVPITLGTPFTLQSGDTISCTLTNTVRAATLTIRQLTLSPVPPNLVLPFTFGYTGNNGLAAQSLTNTTFNTAVLGATQNLAATNTATTLSATSFPDARWLVGGFSCQDTNAPGSGNPTGNLVSGAANSITIPAANVRPGAALRCTALMRHPVP